MCFLTTSKPSSFPRTVTSTGSLGVFKSRNLYPGLIHGLFPQGHLVIPGRHSQDIARHRPAQPPHGCVERTQKRRFPPLLRLPPDVNAAILRTASKHTVRQRAAGRPRNVAHPVRMGGDTGSGFLHPSSGRALKLLPHANNVITRACDQPEYE